MTTAYLAMPGKLRTEVEPYLYHGSRFVDSCKFGCVFEGPADGGFSMQVTCDRLASGLHFGKVFGSYVEAAAHLFSIGREVSFSRDAI